MPRGPLSEEQKAKLKEGYANWVAAGKPAKVKKPRTRRTFEERQALGLVKYTVPREPKPRNPRRTFEERQALGLVKYGPRRLPRRSFEERQALGLVKYGPRRLPSQKLSPMMKLKNILVEQKRIGYALANARKDLVNEMRAEGVAGV